MEKLEIKQEIFSNGKGKWDMESDGLLRQPFHLSREPMENICICNQVSKHGERDDDEGIFVQSVRRMA